MAASTRRIIFPERVFGMSGTNHDAARAGDRTDLAYYRSRGRKPVEMQAAFVVAVLRDPAEWEAALDIRPAAA